MNYSPQVKKSGLHIPAGLIFLINAIAFGLTLFIPLIEDGFDDFGFNEIVTFFMFVGFAIIAVTFLAGSGKSASAIGFGLVAAAHITYIVNLLTSDYAEYVKFISYLPQILFVIAYLFAIAVCQAGAKRTPGTGAAKLWFIPPVIMLIGGIINFVNSFEDVKALFNVVFKYLGEIGDTAVALYYIGELIVALMFLIFPFGMFFGMLWIYKTVSPAPAYTGAPNGNRGWQPYNAQNTYAYNQPNQGYVPPQQGYTPPQQQAYTPPVYTPPQQTYTPPQAPSPERKIKSYDAMTGQPIYEDAAPKKIVGYDAMTGAPIYED